MILQKTIINPVHAEGVGLHGGEKSRISLLPQPPHSGISFVRSDLPEKPLIPAKGELVSETMLCTGLADPQTKASVRTVEHLLSAVYALGIDNLRIEVDSFELPVMDGSAAPFAFLLESAGICEQDAPKHFLRIKRPIRVEDGDKWVEVQPSEDFHIDLTINFDNPRIAQTEQHIAFTLQPSAYVRDIARARTFGFLKDYEWLKSQNLALGGSLENAVVIDDTQILNRDGLRDKNEFVKHKLLDTIGDLSLLGHPLLGQVTSYKSGHALNNRLVRAILADTDNYDIVTSDIARSYTVVA